MSNLCFLCKENEASFDDDYCSQCIRAIWDYPNTVKRIIANAERVIQHRDEVSAERLKNSLDQLRSLVVAGKRW